MPAPPADLKIGYTKLPGGCRTPCSKCGCDSSNVFDTFWSTTFKGTGRGRKCPNCNHTFYTVEVVVSK